MKKNLRIVSAAAAALLAVAPVAASAVTANAEVTNLGAPTNTSTEVKNDLSKINVVVTLKNSKGNNIAYGEKVSDVAGATVTATQNGKTLSVAKVNDSDVHISMGNGSTPASNATFEWGNTYQVKINNLKITGLTTSENGKFAATGKGSFGGDVTAGNLEHGVTYTDTFNVFDPNDKTVPYFAANNGVQVPANGTVSGAVTNLGTTESPVAVNGAKLSDILTAAKNKVKAHKTNVAGDENNAIITNPDDVKSQLEDQKISLKKGSDNNAANYTVDAGSDKSFTVTLTAQNIKSGKTATAKVVFKTSKSDENSNSPIIYYYENGNSKDSHVTPVEIQQGSHQFPEVLPVIPVPARSDSQFQPTNYFKAAINSDHAYGSTKGTIWTNDFTVEHNDVDASKEGLYHVTVSAKNNDGKETKVTVPVAVIGNKDTKIATIKNTPGYPVTVYQVLNGSVVKNENNYDFLYNGTPVKTFETKTIEGKSYTRIKGVATNTNGEQTLASDENAWVESDKLSNYVSPTEASKTAKVMYKSAVYNKDGKTTGKTIAGYTDKDFAVNDKGELKTVKIGNSNFYKIANEDGYVRVRNVTGSKMTLKKNSYVYKSNGKRASKKLYKKGQTITVYGGQYKAIKKYGKKAVRVGVNRYIKVVNVNYKLAD